MVVEARHVQDASRPLSSFGARAGRAEVGSCDKIDRSADVSARPRYPPGPVSATLSQIDTSHLSPMFLTYQHRGKPQDNGTLLSERVRGRLLSISQACKVSITASCTDLPVDFKSESTRVKGMSNLSLVPKH